MNTVRHAVMRLGRTPTEIEEDLPQLGVNSTDTLHFDVGTAVIWEADATHYIDDLSVTMEPQ